MTPLDWFLAAAHFLWILGLSIIVAAFSYHAWRAHEDLRPMILQLRARSWIIAFDAGLILIAVAVAIMPRSERWFVTRNRSAHRDGLRRSRTANVAAGDPALAGLHAVRLTSLR